MPLGNPIRKQNESRMVSVLATEGQTVFTVQGGYIINHISVFRNGVRLSNSEDFTAGDGSTVTLNNAANIEDRIEFHIFDRFTVQNAIVGAASTQTINGDLVLNGKLFGQLDVPSINLTGIVTATELDLNGKGDISSDLTIARHLSVAGVSTFADKVHLLDSDKLHIGGAAGDNGDLQLFHDGSHSYIEDSGTGNLNIESNSSIILRNDGGGVDFAKFINGGGVQLYHNNVERLTTTYSGADVNGTLNVTGISTFAGDMNLGDASSDTITVTGKVDSDISPTGTNRDLGTTSSEWRNLYVTNGVVATDTISSHASDGDTKIRFPSTDTFTVETGGSERLRITSGGQIGIGSAIPRTNFKLDVNGDLSLGESSGTDNSFIDQKQNGQLEIINSGRDDHTGAIRINRMNNISGDTTYFRDVNIYNGKGTSVMYVDGSAASVGINETSPLAKLHVKVADSGASAYAHSALFIEDSDHTFIDIMSGTSGSGGINFGDSGNAQRGVVEYNHSSDYMRFITAQGERLRITSDGKMGLGTASPPAAFHIHYGTDPSLNIFSTQHTQNTGSKINFGVGQSASVGGNTGCRIEHNIPNSGGAMSGELKFYTNNGDSLVEATRITSTGLSLSKTSFISKNTADANVSTSTASGFSSSSSFNVVLAQDVLEAQSTYIISFKWDHQGSGQPYEVFGSFVFCPGTTNPGSAGAMGPNFVPYQGAHTEQGVSKYFTFRYYSPTGSHTHGLQAAAQMNLNDSNGQGTLYMRAYKIGDQTTI